MTLNATGREYLGNGASGRLISGFRRLGVGCRRALKDDPL